VLAGAEELLAAKMSIRIIDKKPANITINPDIANFIVVRCAG